MDETFITDPSPAATDTPAALRIARQLEESSSLDGLVAQLDGLLERTLGRSPTLTSLLRGHSVGHPLHPLLTDLPIGLWSSATVLDVFGGRSARGAADCLVLLGELAALPTIAAGLADWRVGDERIRRVGLVHAGLNAAALMLYDTSWLLRRIGSRRAGVTLSLAGAATLVASGYLGGHLTFRLGSPRDDHT